MIRAYVALVFALVVAACVPQQPESLCNSVPSPEGCGRACDPSPSAVNSCDTGYHCSAAGTCDIQCTQSGDQCGEGYRCSSEGRCEDDHGPGMNGPDPMCPAVQFTPMPTTPSIGLVLDQSGSMIDYKLGTQTRYAAMRDALVGTTGVVSQLEAKAHFGAELYTCNSNNLLEINQVPRALNNASVVRALIDSKLSVRGGNTPTHAAINRMVASFAQTPPPAGSPPAIVLATDGLPNSCDDTGAGGEGASVAAAKAAHAAGIPVYVLAINQTSSHFQDVANAGQGWQPGQPNVKYYPVADAQELKAAFDQIIKGVISCDLSLTSSIDAGQAMNGTLVVNGQTLTYGTDWTLVNGNVIRILGNACTSLKTATSPMVSASFPCGSVIL
ncbi:MAG TPA: vWA domain-containing protein [Kofleriaceae bacterium]|nr:vWA domain-containing protein [Kofleriaceae bacterium]